MLLNKKVSFLRSNGGDRSKNQKNDFLIMSADYSKAIFKIKKMNS